jgi:carboxymethylenebutenolidase
MHYEPLQRLMRSYRAGVLSRRDFLDQTARMAGAGAAAYVLVACSRAEEPAPTIAAELPEASPIAMVTNPAFSTAEIVYNANGGTAPGYLARPTGAGPFPAVVVIQEWWGLDAHIRSIVDRFAAEGFVALAPDLYRGRVAQEPDDARKLAMELVREQALADIQGAVDYLAGQAFVEPKQVGVMGFCMGGGLAMSLSWLGRNIGAAIVFYGGGVRPSEAELASISAPLLGIYGEADAGIPLDLIRGWEAKLTNLGKTHKIIIYPDAPHAFFNDTRSSYRPEAAADAWAQTLEWLRTYV